MVGVTVTSVISSKLFWPGLRQCCGRVSQSAHSLSALGRTVQGWCGTAEPLQCRPPPVSLPGFNPSRIFRSSPFHYNNEAKSSASRNDAFAEHLYCSSRHCSSADTAAGTVNGKCSFTRIVPCENCSRGSRATQSESFQFVAEY